jgi:3-hydroxyisobutyrate dehydrogenase-like beta-hydroxyacid dehydrogenase
MDKPTIAFLGIGLMGKPMAQRLLQAGFIVHAWNRTPAKAQALVASGAIAHASLDDAVASAEIVISILGDGSAVSATIDAAAPALKEKTLWIDMSSTRQDEALAHHETLAGRGVRFLDAPVSGGVAGAQAGTLAIMAGGTMDDFTEAGPVLSAMGSAVLVGPAGSGQVAKLCNQLIVGGTMHIVAEALLLAQAAGADPAAVREAIRGGFAGSKVLEAHGQRMLDRNFIAGGKVTTQLKDQRNVLAAAADAGVALPMTALVTEQYQSIAADLPDADHAAALIALERINPGLRLGDAPDQFTAAASSSRPA